MATVLIIGASKGIGLETVQLALAAGHEVRAMARGLVRVPVPNARLEAITGNALDEAAVKRALTGADAVIQTLGVTPGPELLLKPVRLFSDATRILVAAMRETGVRRLICVTGFGAGDSRDRANLLYALAFHLFLGRIYYDKDAQERIIRDSTLDWVIVRPGILTSGPRTGRYQVLEKAEDWRVGFISRADVADFLVKQIDGDRYLRKTPVLIQ
jgi:putative NADH-flavin reductase